MLRNIIGPLFNFKTCVFLLFFGLVFQKSSSFCWENEIFENKKTKKLDHFLTLKRAKIGPFLTLQHIYICFFLFSFSLSFYLSIYLSIYLYIYISLSLSLSFCLALALSLSLSRSRSLSLSLSLCLALALALSLSLSLGSCSWSHLRICVRAPSINWQAPWLAHVSSSRPSGVIHTTKGLLHSIRRGLRRVRRRRLRLCVRVAVLKRERRNGIWVVAPERAFASPVHFLLVSYKKKLWRPSCILLLNCSLSNPEFCCYRLGSRQIRWSGVNTDRLQRISGNIWAWSLIVCIHMCVYIYINMIPQLVTPSF